MDLDSDDDDLFVEYQLKPVNRLTYEDGLRIKKKVLSQAKLHFSSTKKIQPITTNDIEVIDITKDSQDSVSDVQKEGSKKLSTHPYKGILIKRGRKNTVKKLKESESKPSGSAVGESSKRIDPPVPSKPAKKLDAIGKVQRPNVVPGSISAKLATAQRSPSFRSLPVKTRSPVKRRSTSADCTPIKSPQKLLTDYFQRNTPTVSPTMSPQKLLTDYFQVHTPQSSPGSVLPIKKKPSEPESAAREPPKTKKMLSPSIRESKKLSKPVADINGWKSPEKSKRSASPIKPCTTEPAETEQSEKIVLSPSIRRNRKRFMSVADASESSPPEKFKKFGMRKGNGKFPRKKLFGAPLDSVKCTDQQVPSQMQIPSAAVVNSPQHIPIKRQSSSSFPTESASQQVPTVPEAVPTLLESTPRAVTTPYIPPSQPIFDVPPFPFVDSSLPAAIWASTSASANTLERIDETATSFDAEILIKMIRDVMENQQQLKKLSSYLENEEFCPLLNHNDINVMQKYLMLNARSQTLYMRMFFRKEGWHRVSCIKYEDLGSILEIVLNLKEEGFVETNIESCSEKNQLMLLRVEEIRSLCKIYNIVSAPSRGKEELIDAVIEDSMIQRSVSDMFKSRKSSRLNDLTAKARLCLGPCFQLNQDYKNVLSRVILLFSVVHDVDDESKRASEQRLMLYLVNIGSTRFVPYSLSPTIIFATREDFLEYEKAIELKKDFEVAIASKNYPAFQELVGIVQNYFVRLVVDDEYCERVLALPSFLRRYCAGSVYSYVLTRGCEMFKTKTQNSRIDICSSLLDQTTFGYGSRGKWYDLLAQAYSALFMVNEAAYTILRAAQDTSVNDVWKCYLQLRAQQLLKAKLRPIKDENLRQSLDLYATLSVQEPASIEINAKAVSGNTQGSKLVYVQNTQAGKRYSSVEEQAIYYYKGNGFTEGIHAEGFIVSTIFYLLFFKTVYLPTVPGVFQSAYQVRPLDLFSTSFYLNRRDSIDQQLAEMTTWSMRDVADRIESVFAEFMGTSCVVSWKEYLNPSLLCEIIECIGIPALIKLCERFIYNPRQARSGFPDLTLWNKEKKTCKFVEVKSPKDKLSPKQRVWLDYLRKAGIDCEVCNVKNVAAKKLKEI